LKNRAKAIVYVTHDLDSAATFCTRAIELKDGEIVAYGPSDEVVEQYKSKVLSKA
jgi:ABC-type polysaccharide/polyol phosphate transport system ATPase subunit